MTGYQIATDVRGEVGLEGLGNVPFEFKAGTIEPADEVEAAVLAKLAENGLVELAAAKPAKGKASKSETTSEDKE